jgi:hypothetical protein
MINENIHRKRKFFLTLCSISAAALLIFSIISQIAFAHQRALFNIGGKDYLFVIGSQNEPVFIDDKSGVELFAYTPDPKDPMNSRANGTTPIENLEKALKVEVSAGPKKKVFDFEPAFRDPGHYNAPYYPTVQTTYQYRLTGTINNTPVELPFTCTTGPAEGQTGDNSTVKISNGVERKSMAGGFGCPKSRSNVAFPESYMSNVEIQDKLNQTSSNTISNSNATLITK